LTCDAIEAGGEDAKPPAQQKHTRLGRQGNVRPQQAHRDDDPAKLNRRPSDPTAARRVRGSDFLYRLTPAF
jgi:hypothetical protein